MGWWINGLRADIFVGAILILAAVAYDDFLTYSENGVTANYGAFNVKVEGGGFVDIDGQVDCSSGVDGVSETVDDNCENSCNVRKAFNIISVILAFLAVAITSGYPRIWLATTSNFKTKISAALGIFSMLFAAGSLITFGIQSKIKDSDGVVFGLCAYKTDDLSAPELGTSGILMAIGGGLVGIAALAQACTNPGRSSNGSSDNMAYQMM